MRRREFVGLAGGAAAWPLIARAQTNGSMRRIGVLFGATEGDLQVTKYLGAFSAGLRQLGWIEGQNIDIDYSWARGDIERARYLAKELVSTSPALILTTGTEPALALRETTATVPVVFINVTDLVAGGLVVSLARPSGNIITGFTPFEYDIGGKWLGLLKEMSPRLTRVAMLGDPVNHNFRGFKASFETAAQSLSIEPSSIAVHGGRRHRARSWVVCC